MSVHRQIIRWRVQNTHDKSAFSPFPPFSFCFYFFFVSWRTLLRFVYFNRPYRFFVGGSHTHAEVGNKKQADFYSGSTRDNGTRIMSPDYERDMIFRQFNSENRTGTGMRGYLTGGTGPVCWYWQRAGDGNRRNETGRERGKVSSRPEIRENIPVKFPLSRCFSREYYRERVYFTFPWYPSPYILGRRWSVTNPAQSCGVMSSRWELAFWAFPCVHWFFSLCTLDTTVGK